MQSSVKTVDEYLLEVPEDRKQILEQVRALILTEVPELTESMTYGMAAYTRGNEDVPEVAFASQAKYISIYFPVPVVEAKRQILKGLNIGKCCVRYSSAQKVDLEVLKEVLQETVRQYRA